MVLCPGLSSWVLPTKPGKKNALTTNLPLSTLIPCSGLSGCPQQPGYLGVHSTLHTAHTGGQGPAPVCEQWLPVAPGFTDTESACGY